MSAATAVNSPTRRRRRMARRVALRWANFNTVLSKLTHGLGPRLVGEANSDVSSASDHVPCSTRFKPADAAISAFGSLSIVRSAAGNCRRAHVSATGGHEVAKNEGRDRRPLALPR